MNFYFYFLYLVAIKIQYILVSTLSVDRIKTWTGELSVNSYPLEFQLCQQLSLYTVIQRDFIPFFFFFVRTANNLIDNNTHI